MARSTVGVLDLEAKDIRVLRAGRSMYLLMGEAWIDVAHGDLCGSEERGERVAALRRLAEVAAEVANELESQGEVDVS